MWFSPLQFISLCFLSHFLWIFLWVSPLVLFVIISCHWINVANEKHFRKMFPLCIGSTGYCEGNSTSLLVKLPRQLLFLYETRSVLLAASMVDPIFQLASGKRLPLVIRCINLVVGINILWSTRKSRV